MWFWRRSDRFSVRRRLRLQFASTINPYRTHLPQINLRAFNGIINYQGMDHISDDDLERFHLGKITDDADLASIEEHLLWCSRCLDVAIEAAQYVDAMRVALIGGNFDLA